MVLLVAHPERDHESLNAQALLIKCQDFVADAEHHGVVFLDQAHFVERLPRHDIVSYGKKLRTVFGRARHRMRLLGRGRSERAELHRAAKKDRR